MANNYGIIIIGDEILFEGEVVASIKGNIQATTLQRFKDRIRKKFKNEDESYEKSRD